MDRVAILLTTVEVAVAFAGFGGLAALLGRRRTRDDARIDVMRLRAILEGSLLTGGAAALPVVLLAYGASERVVWRVASVLFLMCALLVVGAWTSRIRLALREGAAFQSGILSFFYGIAIAMTVLLIASLVAGSGRSFAMYLSALYTILFGMAILFLRLVASLVGASAQGDEQAPD